MPFRVIPNFKVKNVEDVVAFLKYVVVDLNLGLVLIMMDKSSIANTQIRSNKAK